MDDSKVEVDQAFAVGPHNPLNSIQFLQLLSTNLGTTVRHQGEVGVARDTTAASAVWKASLLPLVHRSKGQKVRV